MRIDPRNHSGKSPSHGAAHLTAQIENAQDLTWSVDLDFRLVTFNKALANEILKHCGVVAKPGMRPCDLLPPNSLDSGPLPSSALSNTVHSAPNMLSRTVA